MEPIIWLGILAVLLIIEGLTTALTTIWFAGGALIAFVAALLGANIIIQQILWLVVSVILLVLTRPIAKKYIYKRQEHTNADRLIGQEAMVCEQINNLEGTGKVILNGIEWTARTADPTQSIEKGSVIRVLRIEGVKVIVEKGEQ